MVSRFSLEGKVAIVTGATKGLGLGIAKGMAEAGSDIIVVSRNQKDCEKVAIEINKKEGGLALPIAANIRELSSIEALIIKVISHYNRIDILVNNAGVALTRSPETIIEEEWDDVLDLNLKGAFFMAQKVGIEMIKQKSGKIINVGSIFSYVGDANLVPYCASKSGIISMTKSLAVAWARYNIQINALAPGYIETEMNKKLLRERKTFDYIMANTPAKRLGLVDDIVGAVIFLASQASDYMTGQSIVIDGGWLAR